MISFLPFASNLIYEGNSAHFETQVRNEQLHKLVLVFLLQWESLVQKMTPKFRLAIFFGADEPLLLLIEFISWCVPGSHRSSLLPFVAIFNCSIALVARLIATVLVSLDLEMPMGVAIFGI